MTDPSQCRTMSRRSTTVLRVAALVLVVLTLLAYVAYLLVYVSYAVELFRWPHDYDQGEGFELYDAILYSRGEWPYRENSTFPYYASNYPPLFHLLMVPLLPFFGQRLIAGRLLSFSATLVTAGAIAVMVRKTIQGGQRDWMRDWFIPGVSGLAFLASNYVYQIGPLCRMHMTLVMFETLSVAFIANFDDPQHGTRNLILGIVMLFCAGYTKQTAVFTVLAVLAFVILRDVKRALLAGAALAVAAGTVFWMINVATDGQWWINIIQANVNEFDYRQTLFLFRQWFGLHALFAILGAAYLVYELFWDRLSAYSLWFFFALGVGALSGKWGAGFGYFNTAVAAACVTSGLALGKLRRRFERQAAVESRSRTSGPRLRPYLAVLIPMLYLIQAPRMLHLPTAGPAFSTVAQALGVDDQLAYGQGESLVPTHCAPVAYHDAMGYTQLGHPLSPEDYAAGERIMAYVRATDGPIFSEEAMFSILADKPVVTNPTQLLNLYNNGMLATDEIIEDIDQQRYDLVIFRAQFYPGPVLEAIGQSYEPMEQVCMNGFTYHLLSPRQRSENGSDSSG